MSKLFNLTLFGYLNRSRIRIWTQTQIQIQIQVQIQIQSRILNNNQLALTDCGARFVCSHYVQQQIICFPPLE